MRPCLGFSLFAVIIAAVVAVERYSTNQSAAGSFTSSTPLADAVDAFNLRASQHPVGKFQPPLSVNEVTDALDRWRQTEEANMPDAIARKLTEISTTRWLPEGTRLTPVRWWSPGGDYYMHVWWIQLEVVDANRPPYSLPVRRTLLREFGEVPTADASWGHPSENGLQAACYLVPAKVRYTMGAQVDRRVAIRNAGGEPVEFTMPSFDGDEQCTAREDEGTVFDVELPKRGRRAPLVHIRLAPGESQVLYHAPPLRIVHPTELLEVGSDLVVRAQPGRTCRLSWEIDITVRDGERSHLKTGEVLFAVDAPSQTHEPLVSRSPFQPLPNDELIGRFVALPDEPNAVGPLLAGFETLRGSISAFTVEISRDNPTAKQAALLRRIKIALADKAPRDVSIIRIRTDDHGQPDPETWELVRPSRPRR